MVARAATATTRVVDTVTLVARVTILEDKAVEDTMVEDTAAQVGLAAVTVAVAVQEDLAVLEVAREAPEAVGNSLTSCLMFLNF